MTQVQPDHFTPIQCFLRWEASPQTFRIGTVGPKNENTKQYISENTLKTYFDTPETVKRILKTLFPDNQFPDAYIVWSKYRCSFAVLLSIHQGPMIRQFIDFSHLQDRFLPFLQQPESFPESSEVSLFSIFYERQWRYLPLELTYKMRGPISPDVILPFRVKQRIGRGRSADVDKIEVDEDYNSLGHPTRGAVHTSFYAVKTFHGRDAEQYFNTEKDAYERLNDSKPPEHLVAFHGSFTRHGKYHLILQYADRGTLRDFMEHNDPPTSGEAILDLWNSLFGLLLGLHTLHEEGGDVSGSSFMAGWHQDVKPTNVLVKSRENPQSMYDCKFMLADLGLCHFKMSDKEGKDVTDKDTYGTYAYGAPEAHRIGPDVRDTPINVPKRVDIWSLGCIFSEVATWICHGWSRVEQYRIERQKEAARKLNNPEEGDLFHDTNKALDAIEQSHSSIQDSHRVDDFITLKVVKDVISDMLEDKLVRANALQAYNKAQKAIRAAKEELQALRNGNSVLEQTNLLVSIPHNVSERLTSPVHRGTSQAENGSASPYSHQRAPSPPPTQNGDTSNEESPPRLSVAAMLEWRTGKSFGIDKTLPDQELLDAIEGRDSVFLIDNSASMQEHRSDARKILEAVSYAVKRFDKNGVDMICTQSERKILSTERTKRLISVYDELGFKGKTDMEITLGTILQEYRKRFPSTSSSWATKLKCAFRAPPRPLSLYILTDGIWQQGCEVEAVIRQMVSFLLDRELFVKQVAIQFIRFGNNNQQAIDLLNHLDDGLDLDLDIVDTTPANGNAWKMILGAIHTWFDKDNRPMTA